MTTGIVIPAHMNSTRFPGKPLADVGGRPLLSYAVEAARKSGLPWTVASSDYEISSWCFEREIHHTFTNQCRNGTERAAIANQGIKWDRVIVLQCDEPDVTAKDLEWAVAFVKPCTFAAPMQHGDWGNSHSVAVSVFGHASMEGFAASYFRRGHDRSAKVWRHVGVYIYDAKMLADYLQHPPTTTEESQSLEQLRTMAMGYAWHVQPIERPLRSVNVPADVEAFK